MINGFLYNSHIFLSSCLHRMAVNFKLHRNLFYSIHTFLRAALIWFYRDMGGGICFLRTIFPSRREGPPHPLAAKHHTAIPPKTKLATLNLQFRAICYQYPRSIETSGSNAPSRAVDPSPVSPGPDTASDARELHTGRMQKK